VWEAAGGAAIAVVAGLGEVGEELLVVEAVLLDLVAELVALCGQLVDEFDHGRTLALVHGVEEAGARHLHILLADFVAPQVDQELVGQLVVQLEHVVECVVDHFLVVLEDVADEVVADVDHKLECG